MEVPADCYSGLHSAASIDVRSLCGACREYLLQSSHVRNISLDTISNEATSTFVRQALIGLGKIAA